jgi:tRNA A-37 threonylcarbamoyl transferase component Bud32
MQATQKIEGYDSFEQIALGGMAAVYKARKVSLDKPVAIKVLFPHLAQDALYIERFKREAQTAARVQHDNIVNVVDYGESDGSHYIVMEYYDGVTLEELLEAQPAVPLDVCFAVILNVCYGLEAAHAANLVHRDVKPANVIFTRNGGVKIADFGLAKAVDKLKAVTQHGKIIGTPAYMSPEQTRGDEIGTQSDIFSLGVVTYEFACKSRPFDGRNYAEVVDKIQSFHPTSIAEINPLVGAPFLDVIDRMLAKSLETRYLHVSELVLDLEEAIDRAGYRRDRRTLGSYIKDPGRYLESFNGNLLEDLRSKPPSVDGGRAGVVAHYQQIVYLDPTDQQAREELARLDAKPTTEEFRSTDQESKGAEPKEPETQVLQDDPEADYRVYLEDIDLSRETPPSFALKLSMRIRSPLPRVMAIVKNMPAVVGGRLPLKKAKRLAKVIHDMGGIARIEVHPVNESTGSHVPPKPKKPRESEPEVIRSESEPISTNEPAPRYEKPADDRPNLGTTADNWDSSRDKTVEHHPIHERKPGDGPAKKRVTRKCPKCGWDEDVEAKFCSICLFNFNRTEPLNLAAIQEKGQVDNPLADNRYGKLPAQNLIDKIRGLPTTVQYGGLAGLIILLLLIIFGR